MLLIGCASTAVCYAYFIRCFIPNLLNNMSSVYVNFYLRVVVILKD